MRGTGIAVAVLLLGSGLPAQTPTSAELRERAADLAYNLDYPEALATLREAVAADPRDPASARRLAAVAWFTILFRSGAVLVDDYLGQARSNVARQAPPADLDALFRAEIARAIALAEERLRANPRDAEAHGFQRFLLRYAQEEGHRAGRKPKPRLGRCRLEGIAHDFERKCQAVRAYNAKEGSKELP